MTPLFSAAGTAVLEAIVRPGLLCVFDFDGTLAPIVSQPDQARLPASVRERLVALQRRTPVAILTGRALADIGARLQLTADFLVGNHGLEGLPDSSRRRADFLQRVDLWRAALQLAFADQDRFDPQLVLEDKAVSLSVHYRHVQDQTKVRAALEALFATLTPAPRIIAGKCIYNLLPQGAGDKGAAFNQLMVLSGASAAIYVGDDVTDEDVFRLVRKDLLSVRVGHAEDSAAPFFLPHHTDIVLLLDRLIERLALSPAITPATAPPLTLPAKQV